MKPEKIYVVRLTETEVAKVVETLTTMKSVEADNENDLGSAQLGNLINKILEQASK